MATAVAFTINDGQATPAAVTFTPTFRDAQGVYWFRDLVEPNPLLARKFSMSLKSPTKGQKEPMWKANSRFYVPTADITSPTTGTGIQPAPSVAYVTADDHTFMIPQRSTLQNRKDVIAFRTNVNANAQFVSFARDLVMPT